MKKSVISLALSGILPALAAVHGAEIAGMDHIPIAVQDLGSAAQTYERLGFVLKRGRFHANGVSNEHIKFSNGTELELISASEVRDRMTAEYRQFLAVADGPAFLGLFGPNRTELIERLKASRNPAEFESTWITFPQSDPLHYIFFGQRNASDTDRPQYFSHPNGAESLIGVWLADDDFSQEHTLFGSLGATRSIERACTPKCDQRPKWRFAEGEVTLLPSSYRLVPDRKIVGAVVKIQSVEKARALLEKVLPKSVTGGGRPLGEHLHSARDYTRNLAGASRVALNRAGPVLAYAGLAADATTFHDPPCLVCNRSRSR